MSSISPFSSSAFLGGGINPYLNPIAQTAYNPSAFSSSALNGSIGGQSSLAMSSAGGSLQEMLQTLSSVLMSFLQSFMTALQNLFSGGSGSNSGGNNANGYTGGGASNGGYGGGGGNGDTGTQQLPLSANSPPSISGGSTGSSTFSSYSTGGNTGPVTGTGNNSNTWASNVSVYTSSSPTQETVEGLSNDLPVGGYLSDVEKGMDQGQTLGQAAQSAASDPGLAQQGPTTNAGVNLNGLKPHAGGNAIIVTGDNFDTNGTEANQLKQKLQQDYGMNVQFIPDGAPAQLQQAIQQMGQQKGSQCLVAVLAHGAEGNNQNSGDIALGKNDGDQWLHESDLKSWVNQYLAPNYSNVNLLFNSCYSGQFAN